MKKLLFAALILLLLPSCKKCFECSGGEKVCYPAKDAPKGSFRSPNNNECSPV